MRASRSALARRSSRWLRALAIADAAWEANSVSTSSSASVNTCPSALSARKKLPTSTPRWRIGVPWKLRANSRGGLDAEVADPGPEVGQPQRSGQAAQVFEQAQAVGPGGELHLLFWREARGQKVLGRARLVNARPTRPSARR